MQGNRAGVSECVSSLPHLDLMKFPWEVQDTKTGGGCYPTVY